MRGCATRIHAAHRDETQRIFAIGQDLGEAKKYLKHGRFGAWLKTEFGWSERTAQRYMQAYSTFKGKTDTVSILAPSAVYALSARSTPLAVRNDVVTQLEAGEMPNVEEILGGVTQKQKEERRRQAELRKYRNSLKPAAQEMQWRKKHNVQKTASIILERLGDQRAALSQLLKDIDPRALVEALLEAEVVAMKGAISSIDVEGDSVRLDDESVVF